MAMGMVDSRAGVINAASQLGVMSPDALSDISQALYGETWRAHLADLLGVTRQAVRCWSSGRRPIPVKMQRTIRQIVDIEISDRRIAFDRWEAMG